MQVYPVQNKQIFFDQPTHSSPHFGKVFGLRWTCEPEAADSPTQQCCQPLQKGSILQLPIGKFRSVTVSSGTIWSKSNRKILNMKRGHYLNCARFIWMLRSRVPQEVRHLRIHKTWTKVPRPFPCNFNVSIVRCSQSNCGEKNKSHSPKE